MNTEMYGSSLDFIIKAQSIIAQMSDSFRQFVHITCNNLPNSLTFEEKEQAKKRIMAEAKLFDTLTIDSLQSLDQCKEIIKERQAASITNNVQPDYGLSDEQLLESIKSFINLFIIGCRQRQNNLLLAIEWKLTWNNLTQVWRNLHADMIHCINHLQQNIK